MTGKNSCNVIFARGLRLDMHVGIYDHERGRKQPVLIDIEIYLDDARRWTRDDIRETFAYDEIGSRIEAVAGRQHFELLETFLELVAADFMSVDIVHGITLSIEKPGILKNAQSAGVRITRFKTSY